MKRVHTTPPAKFQGGEIDKVSKPAPGLPDDPEGRESWFMFQRMYPFNEIPARARSRAWDSVPARDKQKSTEAVGTVWSPIGPLPTTSALQNNGGFTSGRINAIAVSPPNNQIVLIASATGGIWRSTNGGTTFAPVSDSQVDLAVGTIAFAPSNSNIVYAGMGDNDNGYWGTGVLKSTDAGATWTRINNNTFPDRGQSTRIRVDPANPNKVYLAQHNSLTPADCNPRQCPGVIGGIFVSTDGGVNWTRTLPGLASDLAIHPTNSQIIYAALRFGQADADPRGLFKSTDGGLTWNNVFLSPYNAAQDSTTDFRVSVTPAAPDRVYVYFGSDGPPAQVRLEMSDNAGTTWTNRGVVNINQLDPGQFGYNTYLEASPVDANTVAVGARDTFRSTDGGATFTNINNSFIPPWECEACYTPDNQKFHADQQSFTFEPGSSTTFYCGNDGGLWKTTDSGATFTSLNPTLSLTQFVSIAVHPTDGTKSYGGTQDNGSQRRTAGTGWHEFSGGDGGRLVINPVDPSMVFHSYVFGVITRALNDGGSGPGQQIANRTLLGEPAPPNRRIAFYPPIVGNGVDSKLYVGTWRLLRCDDCADTSKSAGGTPPTWTPPGGTFDQTNGNGDVLSAIAVARSNNNVIYTGSGTGRAMVSTNGGANWTDISAGLPNRSITGLTVSPTDPTLVYLTVSGYGTGHIFRSTNSGGAWTGISNNLPNIPTNALLIDPLTPTTLYAGTDIGVFRSTDNGGTWTVFNNGLPPVPVMAFSAQAGGLIQIGTYGRGAYELPTTGNPTTVQFSGATYNVSETGPRVDITLTRSGNTTAAASVNYATNDAAGLTNCNVFNGIASPRCDYTNTLGTMSFAAGETSKIFSVAIVDDAYAEGNETFTIGLSGPSGATLGTQSTATVTITDNDAVNGTNPIDSTGFFVRQQYIDFLGREPDPPGFAGWSNTINNCAPGDTNCDRIHVSQLFFQSAEFQDRGYFVYRFYPVAFGRKPDYAEFVPDLASVSGFLDATQLEAAKVAFIAAFMARPAFVNTYNALNNTQYVDTLLTTAAVTLPAPTRQAMIDGLTNAALTRAQVLRQIVESTEVSTRYRNQAYAVMEYFGYLRRQPDGFYLQWIADLDLNNNPRGMVTGFVTSQEYRNRFGP